jgi:cyclic dehypoxanthinyl futalosine synthase
VRLYESASLFDLGRAADARRRSLHPQGVVTYIIDRNVNYTNACTTACQFCNFYRPPGDARVYTLTRDELAQKLQETVDLGGIQVLLQGGVNPELGLDLLRGALSLDEGQLSHRHPRAFARGDSLSRRAGRADHCGVLERLVAAGLDSVPGGGAEILDDEIRRRISPNKCSVATWLDVMRQAHRLGLRTTATMVFGFGEKAHHLVGHLDKLRALQDETRASPPSSAGASRPRAPSFRCATTPRPRATCARWPWRACTSTTFPTCKCRGSPWARPWARSGCASAATISARP